MTPLIHLEGKVAIVTGGSRGIGEAIARSFAAHGAKVVVASRRIEGVERVAAEIRDGGGQAIGLAFHAGDIDGPAKLVDAALAKLGVVDVLVNNAGTNPYMGPAVDVPQSVWEKTFEVNLRGYFEGARAVAKHLIARGAPGSIINIGSVQGLVGAPNQCVYAMTKAAIFSMTHTLAVELGPSNIRVNALAPGLVDTKFAAPLFRNPERFKHASDCTPLRRLGRPEDLAGIALLLASDASSWITGCVIPIDGGITIANPLEFPMPGG